MTDSAADETAVQLARARFTELLELLAQQGLSQQAVATKAGLPAQYLSDIKHGRRPMTELVARRLGGPFMINYEWLMGLTNVRTATQAWAAPASAANALIWLPLFPHPIQGEPRAVPHWTGSGIELSGVAAARLKLAQWPYVLQFDHDDVQGRLRRGDLVLVSQTPTAAADIHVVQHGKKLFLARLQKNNEWERVANRVSLPASCPVRGHCVAIVWGLLSREPK